MQPSNNKIAHLKKSSVAVLTALYVGTSGYAAAEPGFNKVSDKGFYQPTFTAEDIAKYQEQKQIADHPSLLKGSVERLNQHYQNQQPEHVFQPQEGVTGVQTYIVQMTEEPVASYQGDIQGFTATAVTESRSLMVNERLDTSAHKVRAYQGFLKQRQTSVLGKARAVGASIDVKKQFTLANNAVVVEMTQADAEATG